MNIALTKKELASLAGYSYQRLHTLDLALEKDRKLFVTSETDPKKYDLATFVQRWAAYNAQAAEQESEELNTIKARHEAVKMEKTKIEVAKLKGEYVSINELAPIWTQIAATVADRFNGMPAKLAPSLVMIGDPDIIEAAIEREVRDAMNLLSGMPTPETAEAEEEEAAEPEEDEEAGKRKAGRTKGPKGTQKAKREAAR